MGRISRIAAALLIAAGMAGCSTVINLGMPLPPCGRSLPTRVYGGVELLAAGVAQSPYALFSPFIYLEFVLSLCADTLTLPYTLYATRHGPPPRPSGVYDPRYDR